MFLVTLGILLVAGNVMADTAATLSVNWLTPANGSSYDVGTVLGAGQPDGPITGVASASGSTGGTGLDLVLVIDVSGSMLGSKLTAAKAAANAMINSLPDNTTQVGIVAFNSSANMVSNLIDLTANKTALHTAVNSLVAGGGTYIGLGIDMATSMLIGPNAIPGHAKMQVVLSDGVSAGNPGASAAAAYAHGITVHSVGVPGHNVSQMQAVATQGHGVYTDVTDISQLENLFNGTGGNLVGIDHVDIQLADGTMINNIAIDGLGNFILPDWVVVDGAQSFIATAYDTLGNSASATLTINGKNAPVPEPATMFLLGTGIAGLAGMRRRKKK
jgi:hypothetical protein